MKQNLQKKFDIKQSEKPQSTNNQLQEFQWIKSKLGLTNDNDFQELLQIFSEFDTDNSGSVSIKEWRQAMKRFGHDASEQQISELLRQNNIQPEQELTLFEFIGLINRKKQNMKGQYHNQLSRAFRLFDKDLDGVITAKQLKQGLERSGETMRLEDLQLLVSIGDKDGDKTINFNQFCHIMTLK